MDFRHQDSKAASGSVVVSNLSGYFCGGVPHFKALSESTRAKGKPSRFMFQKEAEKSCSMPRRSKLIKPVSLSWFVVVSAGRGASKSKQRNSGRVGFWRELCPFEHEIVFCV